MGRVILCFTVFALTLNQATAEVWKAFKPVPDKPAYLALKKRVDSFANKRGIEAGIMALNLQTQELIYSHSPDNLVIPASVNKVFTAYTALKRLKPTSMFKTGVYATGSVRDGVLTGDLYLKGGGDPSLVSERLWMLVNELVRSGIKTITGDIIADSSYFDSQNTPETRPKYLKDQAYNAPIGALSFNFNTCTVYVKPAEKVGAPPIVYTDPENSYIDVVNQATTGKAGSRDSLAVSRTDYVKGDLGDTVLLRGTIPKDSDEQRFYRNIVNPALYATHMFKTFWERRGLKVGGHIKEGLVPGHARKVLEFESQPLWHIIWGMNKFSNNFVADQILKKVGAEKWGPPGTLDKGLIVMQEALEDLGIPKKDFKIFDGSGLTRMTRVTARQIMTVLVAAYHDFSIAPEFIASLGVAGEDGTLRRRFPNSMVREQLRAKTGTLDGVTALAGFTPDADGDRVAFAIIFNDSKGRYGTMKAWVDQIALEFATFSKN